MPKVNATSDKNVSSRYFCQKTKNKSMYVRTHFFDTFFQNYSQDLKNGHFCTSKNVHF